MTSLRVVIPPLASSAGLFSPGALRPTSQRCDRTLRPATPRRARDRLSLSVPAASRADGDHGRVAHCANTQRLAREAGYTLLCGRYAKDGYTWYDLRAKRHLDWGNLSISPVRSRDRARSQAGGWAAGLRRGVVLRLRDGDTRVASPELRPSRLIVVDSYLDLVAAGGTRQPIRSGGRSRSRLDGRSRLSGPDLSTSGVSRSSSAAERSSR